MAKLRITLVLALIGCQALSHNEAKPVTGAEPEARRMFAAGELYQARQLTRKILEKNPSNKSAQKLMAQIIDREIAREKEAFEPKAAEEFTYKEKADEARVWLDRSKTLFSIGRYEEAILAAEKVFLYDPDNLEASRLMDEVREKARREGKSDLLFLKRSAEDEIRERLETYRKQAKRWIREGKWGMAKLTVEKILLLVPEDREALGLYEKIRAQKKIESL